MLRYRTVCTLEQAKRLKELGVLQNSNMYWEIMRQPVIEGCATERLTYVFNIGHPLSASVVEDNFSAFDVAELGVMLPQPYGCKNEREFKAFVKRSDFPILDIELEFLIFMSDNSEAEARAALLIYLIEQRAISVDDINYSLQRSDDNE